VNPGFVPGAGEIVILVAVHGHERKRLGVALMVRGNYTTQTQRYWGVLRTAINDLGRTHGVTPLGA
jgi:hypothetical protein